MDKKALKIEKKTIVRIKDYLLIADIRSLYYKNITDSVESWRVFLR
jgi:hypothetical protein